MLLCRIAGLRGVILIALLGTSACRQKATENSTVTVTPSRMQRVKTVDERYQSYNVEMLEVTGGKSGDRTAPSLTQFSNSLHRSPLRPAATHLRA